MERYGYRLHYPRYMLVGKEYIARQQGLFALKVGDIQSNVKIDRLWMS